ncbi:imidazolonepropionase-like domain-containing protein [Streptomyces antimicrobicus]|uniref:Aminodeoxyfutalosine deaminase/Imidazolonepropionase-like composite domain-containing protein n=1 Tax=Streptomyces antimicrobicus TaxID=2883108 RepID=A0ABS8B7B3_9ACTN|nr:hypothetical protein [Streptomyces antimicrobicus]MCB5180513.1 hypothetical protein [Streptomyces antimicrobicus]
MLTLHAAELVLPGAGLPPVPGGAVLVRGAAVEAVGPEAELTAAWPGARVRRWPGLLTPGLVQAYGVELLEETYHPDPREAEAPWPAPGPGDTTRWSGSARRGVQRLLAHGVVAVAGAFRHRWAAEAVTRSGLVLLPAAARPGPASLDPLTGCATAAAAYHGTLTPGAPAHFAAFAVPDEPALLAHGASTCTATVVAGRLLHRRR